MSKIAVYYFSGTGNSLHIAQEVQKRVEGVKLIPIISLLEYSRIIKEEESIGFVFPIYLSTIPNPVLNFIQKLDLNSIKYIFVITTHCGLPGKVAYQMQKILKQKGKNLDAYFDIKMISNSPTGLMPAFMVNKKWAETLNKERIEELQKQENIELDKIQKTISNREKNIFQDIKVNFISKIFQNYLINNIKKSKAQIAYFVDSDCNSCGICEKVCTSGKIKIVSGKPQWQENKICYYCYACFNYCPKQAILVRKNYELKDGRYNYPGIKYIDIYKQKGDAK